MTMNYDLVMKGLTTYLFPLKALIYHKISLHQGLFNTQDYKIREFILCVRNIVKYLDHLLPFGMYDGIPCNKIMELVEFTPPHEWQKQLLVQ